MNNYISTKEISIQISLDGYSFMMHDTQSARVLHAFESVGHNFSLIGEYLRLDHQGVRVIWNVARAQVIPLEVFDESLCEQYMEMANLKGFGREEVSLWGAHHGGQWVAIWQADAQLYKALMAILRRDPVLRSRVLGQEYDPSMQGNIALDPLMQGSFQVNSLQHDFFRQAPFAQDNTMQNPIMHGSFQINSIHGDLFWQTPLMQSNIAKDPSTQSPIQYPLAQPPLDLNHEQKSAIDQQIHHTHPLLMQIEGEPSPETVTIHLMPGIAHIKIYNRQGELTLAESIATNNPNDLLLLVRQGALEDTFKQYRILVAGENAQQLAELMATYYGRVNYL